MVMSSSGGIGPEMTIALKHLARKLADKKNEPYSKTINVLRCRLNFSMLRSALVCLRGSRSLRPRTFEINQDVLDTPVSVIYEEARLG